MGKQYCKIYKIGNFTVDISATYETNRYFQTDFVLYDLDIQLYRDIYEMGIFTVYAKTDTRYISAFDCAIMKTKIQYIDNKGNAQNSKIYITSRETAYGTRYFNNNDRIHEIVFEVTDGTELLGLIP